MAVVAWNREIELILHCLKLIDGEDKKITRFIVSFSESNKEEHAIHSLHDIVEYLLKIAYKKEGLLTTKHYPPLIKIIESINDSEKNRFPRALYDELHPFRLRRNSVAHGEIKHRTVTDVKKCALTTFAIMQWFYRSYHGIIISDDIYNAIQITEAASQPKDFFNKPSHQEVSDFISAVTYEVERLNTELNWDEGAITIIPPKVQIIKNGILKEEEKDLLGVFREILDLEGQAGFKGKLWRYTHSITLLGDPGSGKSVALRGLHKLISKRKFLIPENHRDIPIYLRVSDWQESGAINLTDYIFEKLASHPSTVISSFTQRYFYFLLKKRRFIFLLDGFDEIPAVLSSYQNSEIIEDISLKFQRFSEQWKNRTVLASRKFKSPSKKYYTSQLSLMLVPPSESAIISIYSRHPLFGYKVLKAIYNSPKLRGLLETPLTISLLKSYLQKNNGELPNSVSEVYKQGIENKVNSDKLKEKFNLSVKELIDCSIAIAGFMHKSNISEEHASNTELYGLNAPIDKLIDSYPKLKIRSVISALKYFRLGRGNKHMFTFIHRVIYDYFVALHILDLGLTSKRLQSISNRNTVVLCVELATPKQADRIFSFYWNSVKLLKNSKRFYGDTKYQLGLTHLRLIVDSFKSKREDWILKKYQPHILRFIKHQMEYGDNLIVKKQALEASQLLNAKNGENLLEECLSHDYIYNQRYLYNSLIDTTRYMESLSKKALHVVKEEYIEKLDSLASKTTFSFESISRFRPFFLNTINELVLFIKVIRSYSSYAPIVRNFIVAAVVYALLNILFGLLFIVGTITFIFDPKSWLRAYEGLIVLFLVIGGLLSLVWALAITKLMIRGAFKRIIFFSLYWENYRESRSKKRIKSVGSFEELMPPILGAIGVLIGVLSLFFRESLTEHINFEMIIYFLIPLCLIVFLVSIKDFLKAGFIDDFVLLRRIKFILKNRDNSRIDRKEIATWFDGFRSSYYRERFVKQLKKYVFYINPRSIWPQKELPNVNDDNASNLLAELEESLLGLRDTQLS